MRARLEPTCTTPWSANNGPLSRNVTPQQRRHHFDADNGISVVMRLGTLALPLQSRFCDGGLSFAKVPTTRPCPDSRMGILHPNGRSPRYEWAFLVTGSARFTPGLTLACVSRNGSEATRRPRAILVFFSRTAWVSQPDG